MAYLITATAVPSLPNAMPCESPQAFLVNACALCPAAVMRRYMQRVSDVLGRRGCTDGN